MAYDLTPITVERALAAVEAAPGLKQPHLLDILRGPLEYYAADGPDADVPRIYAGDVLPRPHLDLSAALQQLSAEGQVIFSPRGASGGWRKR